MVISFADKLNSILTIQLLLAIYLAAKFIKLINEKYIFINNTFIFIWLLIFKRKC